MRPDEDAVLGNDALRSLTQEPSELTEAPAAIAQIVSNRYCQNFLGMFVLVLRCCLVFQLASM